MKVVTPYRPFPPESDHHATLGRFDWVAAIRMLGTSVSAACGPDVRTIAITDVDTALPVEACQYQTVHRRLMLWVLEVCLRYIESDDFDQDTVMMSPDQLVFDDLARCWQPADLGVLLRMGPKFAGPAPLLNGVQFWRQKSQDALAEFYRTVLTRAEMLPEETIRWGADTQPIRELLEPLRLGYSYREGLKVYAYDADAMLAPLRNVDVVRLAAGLKPKTPRTAIVDFRALRKWHMAEYYTAMFTEAA